MKKGIIAIVIFAAVIGVIFMNRDNISRFDGTWMANDGDVIKISEGAKKVELGSAYFGTPVIAEDIEVDEENQIITFTTPYGSESYKKDKSTAFDMFYLKKVDPETGEPSEEGKSFYKQHDNDKHEEEESEEEYYMDLYD